MLTAARSGEMRLATWDEMDLDAGIWTIPGAAHEGEAGSPRPAFGAGGSRSCTTHGRRSNGTGLVFRSLRAGSHSPTRRYRN